MVVRPSPVISETLFLLVTCSMDRARAKLATTVAENLIEHNNKSSFFDNLLIFDNNSNYKEHLQGFPGNVRVALSNLNIGYWSAINWTLDNYQSIFNRDYKYIYIIESDLLHYDFDRIWACENFLNLHPIIGSVRTQEFSVRLKFLYDKKYTWLPFSRENSVVSQLNAVTKEKIWFKLTDPKNKIWITNFHTKLPALNRISAMKEVFRGLCISSESVSEMQFIKRYHDIYKLTAVLDGGIYKIMNSINSHGLSGSYSKPEELEKFGYRATRFDAIIRQGFDIQLPKR